ncbi:MAG: S8 family serine peptidase [Candidatus Geothermincolales bacterium]
MALNAGAIALLILALLSFADRSAGGFSSPRDFPDARRAVTGEMIQWERDFPPGSYRDGEVLLELAEAGDESLARFFSSFGHLLAQDGWEMLVGGREGRRGPILKLRLKDSTGVEEACRALLSSPLVKRAEPNGTVRLAEVDVSATYSNDPLLSRQWNLGGGWGVRALEAWDLCRGSGDLVVAVVDTGVDFSHPELVGRLLPGYDFYEDDPYPQDENGHGTHVAGVICAATDNGMGIAGIDWRAKIMPLRALGPDGNGTVDAVVKSVSRAVDGGARVINMSLISSTNSGILADVLADAHSRGCFLVAAVGNQGDTRVNYPAGHTYIVGVGSTDRNGNRSSFSNYNDKVDFAAPGEGIYGTWTGRGYKLLTGTSSAAPHVSGAALLLLADQPDSMPDEVFQRLRDSARDRGSPGYDGEYGWGIVDLYAALCTPRVRILAPEDGSFPGGGRVKVRVNSNQSSVKKLELLVDGAVVDQYQLPVPSGAVDHEFSGWDLSRLDEEGSHRLEVRAVATRGSESYTGRSSVTVFQSENRPSPSTSWYLAEGTTAWGFEEYLLVQNPNPERATVRLTFMFPDGRTQTRSYAMPGTSRLTVPVNSLFSADHSTRVEADRPVVVERAMYWPAGGRQRAGGHCETGSAVLSRTWCLAEGTTAWGFEEYLLIANPYQEIAEVEIVFQRPDGTQRHYSLKVPERSRRTVMANRVDAEKDASIMISSNVPLAVERAVYWSQKEGGTVGAGAFSP